MKVFCCLWRGENLPAYSNDVYGMDDVDRLARGVELHVPDGELVLLMDDHYTQKWTERETVPANVSAFTFSGWGVGGWSNVLEVFQPLFWPQEGERHIAVGLDTVLTGDCSWLFEWSEAQIGLPLDPFFAPQVCDAVITWDAVGAETVWKAFLESREDGMQRDLYMKKPSEMALLRRLRKMWGWPPLEAKPKRLLSYKVHVHKRMIHIPDEVSMVYFHGRPKPADLRAGDPVREIWLSQ